MGKHEDMKTIERRNNNNFPGKVIGINSLFEVLEGTNEAIALENKLREFSHDSYSVSVGNDGSKTYTVHSQELKKILFEVKGGALLPSFASENNFFDKFVFAIKKQEVSGEEKDNLPKIFEIKNEEKKSLENKEKNDGKFQQKQEQSYKSNNNVGSDVLGVSAIGGTIALIGVYSVVKKSKNNNKKT